MNTSRHGGIRVCVREREWFLACMTFITVFLFALVLFS